jgi:hypothetical protein
MAKPPRTGLDYFPLDVFFYNDDKFMMVSEAYGLKGEMLLIRLFAEIYSDKGFFLEWTYTKKSKLRRICNCELTIEEMDDIVRIAVEAGLFDASLYNADTPVLTSEAIQRRFALCKKQRLRKSVVTSPYWLLPVVKKGEQQEAMDAEDYVPDDDGDDLYDGAAGLDDAADYAADDASGDFDNPGDLDNHAPKTARNAAKGGSINPVLHILAQYGSQMNANLPTKQSKANESIANERKTKPKQKEKVASATFSSKVKQSASHASEPGSGDATDVGQGPLLPYCELRRQCLEDRNWCGVTTAHFGIDRSQLETLLINFEREQSMKGREMQRDLMSFKNHFKNHTEKVGVATLLNRAEKYGKSLYHKEAQNARNFVELKF